MQSTAETRARPIFYESPPPARIGAGLPAGAPDAAARDADALALSVSYALDRIAVPLARSAAALVRGQSWFEFGYARLDDHSRERFGRSGRWVREMAALGEAMSRMPALETAIAGDDGGRPLGLAAAMLVGRVASSESLAAWLDVARRVTVRELQMLVRQARATGSAWPEGGGSDAGSARGGPEAEPMMLPPGDGVAGCMEEMEDDDSVRELVRMRVPVPVRAAFDEALELFRAIEGSETPISGFIEALVAETVSGPCGDDSAFDVERRPLRASAPDAVTEAALSCLTDHWRHLPARSDDSWALAMADAGLRRFEKLSVEAGRGDSVCLDSQIRELLGMQDYLERRLGDLLSDMSRQSAWRQLGFDGCAHYAEERLGLSRSGASQRLQVARNLIRLPLIWQAYQHGEIGLEAASLIMRNVSGARSGRDETACRWQLDALQQRWLVFARSATVKRMRDEARLGGRCFDVESATDAACGPMGSFGPAGPCDDDAWHASLRREPGMSRARVTRWGLAAADAVVGGGEAARRVVPDVFQSLRLASQLAADFLAAVGACRRRIEQTVSVVPPDVPWPEAAGVPVAGSLRAARHYFVRGRSVPDWVGLLGMLEDFVNTWDAGRRVRGDEIYVRDGWRCSAPGCSSRRNLEDHHIIYRSHGGGDELSNRTCLCRFHHQRGEHGGLASCRGTAPRGIVWVSGREGIGGVFRNERRVGTAAGV